MIDALDQFVRFACSVVIIPMWAHNFATGMIAWRAGGAQAFHLNQRAFEAAGWLAIFRTARMPNDHRSAGEISEYSRFLVPWASVPMSLAGALGHAGWALEGGWQDETYFYVFLIYQILGAWIIHHIHADNIVRARAMGWVE